MKKKINWGFYPDEPIRIQSIVEIIIYILIFSLCLYLYNKWYEIPQKEVNIRVENLGIKDSNRITNKYCNVYYVLPMTKNHRLIDERIDRYGEEKAKATLRASFYYDNRPNFHRFLRPGKAIIDSIRNDYSKETFDEFEFKTEETTLRFYDRIDSAQANVLRNYSILLPRDDIDKQIDSLKSFFCNHASIYEGSSLHYVYAEMNLEGLTLNSQAQKGSNEYNRVGKINNYLYFEKYGASYTPYYFYNLSLTSKDDIWEKLSSYNPFYSNTPFELPSFFKTEDISQAYVSFKIESLTIDSINIKFDFVGATEFSHMTPEPDEIGVNYIEFRDPKKISAIRLYGLTFLAKFKDLEGVQQIRLFTVTAIMGGLLTIFVVFLILYYFKIKRALFSHAIKPSDKEEDQDNKSEEVAEVANDDVTKTETSVANQNNSES